MTITRPDDWHLHLRDGAHLRAVLPGHGAALRARDRDAQSQAAGHDHCNSRSRTATAFSPRCRRAARFEPLMTLYLTDNTQPEEIAAARASGAVHAVKYYPAGATTHSDAGVTDIAKCRRGARGDGKARAAAAGARRSDRCRTWTYSTASACSSSACWRRSSQRFPGLKVVLEHITTREAVEFVTAAPPRVAATITAHHLLLSRNAIVRGR